MMVIDMPLLVPIIMTGLDVPVVTVPAVLRGVPVPMARIVPRMGGIVRLIEAVVTDRVRHPAVEPMATMETVGIPNINVHSPVVKVKSAGFGRIGRGKGESQRKQGSGGQNKLIHGWVPSIQAVVVGGRTRPLCTI